MKPWSSDASELNPQDIPSTYIYKNAKIKEYLEHKSHERKLFLIGSKGSGKTLLLRYKAYLYWKKSESDGHTGYRVSASNELIESLEFSLVTLSQGELETLANINTWKNIWNFAISLVIVRRLKIELPKKIAFIEDDFPANFRLNNIVSEIITNVSDFITSDYFSKTLNHLSALLNNINYPFVLFIDRLDQALETLLSNEEYKYLVSSNGDSPPFSVWQAAQYGLLICSYNMTTAVNSHIKIFATARKESLNVRNELRANILPYCTELDYEKSELQEIFENNIANTPKEYLHKDANGKNGRNLFMAFLGFEQMPHIKARDEFQNPQVEQAFDFILRHTFERPREIVYIGRLIYDKVLSKPDFHKLSTAIKIERIRRIVNNASHKDILRNYLNEIVPAFRKEDLHMCAETVSQNLITAKDLANLDIDVVNYLYRIGLIGYVQQGIQRFLPASQYVHDKDEKIPVSTYYMLHPSIDGRLQQKRNFWDFYNEYCIIGNGYPFNSPPLYRLEPKELSHFIPREIPGKDENIDNRWKKARIEVPVNDLFHAYFVGQTMPENLNRRQKKVNDALKLLTLCADITAIRLLKKEFGQLHESLSAWEDATKEQLAKHINGNTYEAQIRGISDASLRALESRLFGRLVAAGMIIYLDTDYCSIRQVLRHLSFDVRPDDNEETAIKFLRTAFFIANLPNVSAPALPSERRKVLEGLSEFEQERLRDWWLHYKEHVLFEKNFLTDQHKAHLKQKMGITF